jgi:hypothetical protein
MKLGFKDNFKIIFFLMDRSTTVSDVFINLFQIKIRIWTWTHRFYKILEKLFNFRKTVLFL